MDEKMREVLRKYFVENRSELGVVDEVENQAITDIKAILAEVIGEPDGNSIIFTDYDSEPRITPTGRLTIANLILKKYRVTERNP